MRDDFAIFILTHGRPNNQRTLETIRREGYTGKVYLVVDDLDKTFGEYKHLYDNVIVFDKMKYVDKTDCGLSEPKINFAVFARNAIEDIAKDMGYKFFGMFDDDLERLRFRYEEDNHLMSVEISDLDSVIDAVIEYMEDCNIATTSFAPVPVFIGGLTRLRQRNLDNGKLRECFNVVFRNSSFDVTWGLNMHEDRITSMMCGRKGQIWQMLLFIQMDLGELFGKEEGGNSSVYREMDKFQQVFFPTLVFPDSIYVSYYNNHFTPRVIGEDNICNKIVSGGYKK